MVCLGLVGWEPGFWWDLSLHNPFQISLPRVLVGKLGVDVQLPPLLYTLHEVIGGKIACMPTAVGLVLAAIILILINKKSLSTVLCCLLGLPYSILKHYRFKI
jgi:hypothetical protein